MVSDVDRLHLPTRHDLEAVGIDLETSGLVNGEPGGLYAGGWILEVGLAIVTADLEVRAVWHSPVHPGVGVDALRAECLPIVQEMHDASGLWDQCRTAPSLVEVQAAAVEWVNGTCVADPRKLPLLGSSVHTDREWLKHGGCAQLASMFHYRNIDVSSVKELVRRLYPGWVPELRPRGAHRVVSDLLDTVDELRFYRDQVFVAVPAGAWVPLP